MSSPLSVIELGSIAHTTPLPPSPDVSSILTGSQASITSVSSTLVQILNISPQPNPSAARSLRFQTLIRQLVGHLRNFGSLISKLWSRLWSTWKVSGDEPPKVIIHHGRKAVARRMSVHLVPLAAALCLVSLNFQSTLVPQQEGLEMLQFAAKFHEILMQLSIATIAMTAIRQRLLVSQPTSFGSLLVGIQITDVAKLWSLEFWGLVTTPYMSLAAKLPLSILIACCIMLAASVGPSSAILMLPRPLYYTIWHGIAYFYADQDALPTKLTADQRGFA